MTIKIKSALNNVLIPSNYIMCGKLCINCIKLIIFENWYMSLKKKDLPCFCGKSISLYHLGIYKDVNSWKTHYLSGKLFCTRFNLWKVNIWFHPIITSISTCNLICLHHKLHFNGNADQYKYFDLAKVLLTGTKKYVYKVTNIYVHLFMKKNRSS